MTTLDDDNADPKVKGTPVDIQSLLDDTELFRQAGGLLSTRSFIDICNDRGLHVVAEELEFYEKNGLLYPLLRMPRPVQWYSAEGSPVDLGEGAQPLPGMFRWYKHYDMTGRNLLALRDDGLLTQPSAETFRPWAELRDEDAPFQEKVETYYVLYHILHVKWLREHLTLEKSYRRPVNDSGRPVLEFKAFSDRLLSDEHFVGELQELNDLVAFLLVIQNQYRPGASGILSGYHNRDDYQHYQEAFSPESAWSRVPIPLEKLRTTRWLLCHQAREVDPLVNWHDLVGYVGSSKRWKLRGTALLSQELYTIISMISRFLSALAEQRGETEQRYSCLGSERYEQRMYGRRLNYVDNDILEQILTEYDLNPRPKVVFVVEGDTEAAAIPIICEAMEARLSTFGIELHNIAGAGNDLNVLMRYAAPPRLGVPIEPGVYAAVRQTHVFALFDREQRWQHDTYVERFLAGWRTTINNILPDDMPPETKEYIAKQGVSVERWQSCFEFDNFTDEELAEAISSYARLWRWPEVDAADVAACRARFPTLPLKKIIAEKVRTMIAAGQEVPEHRDYEWDKVEVGKLLASRLAKKIAARAEGDGPEAPIVEKIERVIKLALSSWP